MLNARDFLRPTFGVLYGDSYLPFNYSRPFKMLDELKAQAVMCVHRNHDQWERSNVRVVENKVMYYSKAALPGDADCIDFGFSVFRKEVFDDYGRAARPLDLAMVFQGLIARHQLAGQIVSERFYEIGSLAGWSELQAHLLK